MANELVEFGDDLDLDVEGLNRPTVYGRSVPGKVWRTLIDSSQTKGQCIRSMSVCTRPRVVLSSRCRRLP
jgi:hypothetical protein